MYSLMVNNKMLILRATVKIC